MFPPRLVGLGAAVGEICLVGAVLRRKTCVVILYFVVVPDHKPRTAGMAGLQVLVQLVQGVSISVPLQGSGFVGAMRSYVARRPDHILGGTFVDVVAKPDHKVRTPFGDVAVRMKVGRLVVLTTCGGEGSCRRRLRCRTGGAHRTGERINPKPVVPGTRVEVDDGVHTMPVICCGGCEAGCGN